MPAGSRGPSTSSSTRPGRRWGSVNLADLTTFPERATVSTISYAGGCFDIAWSSTREGDPGCCRHVGRHRLRGVRRPGRGTDAQLHDETQLLQALSAAAGDPVAIAALYVAGADTSSATLMADNMPPSLDGYTCFGALDAPFAPGQAGAVDAERACVFNGSLPSLVRVDFGSWRIGDAQFFGE